MCLRAELGHFGRIPDDVILAHLLKPERLTTERAFADLAVPDKEAGSERLAVDLRPTLRVDQKREQILLAAIESRVEASSIAFCGGRKSAANSATTSSNWEFHKRV